MTIPEGYNNWIEWCAKNAPIGWLMTLEMAKYKKNIPIEDQIKAREEWREQVHKDILKELDEYNKFKNTTI